MLRIDDKVSLFESNAIAEYLDETIAPRLHPEDPVRARSTGPGPTTCRLSPSAMTGVAYADDEADRQEVPREDSGAVQAARGALEKQGAGPFFNGAKYSLVDAAYAPFLQRYTFLDRIRPLGRSKNFRG